MYFAQLQLPILASWLQALLVVVIVDSDEQCRGLDAHGQPWSALICVQSTCILRSRHQGTGAIEVASRDTFL